MAYPLRLMIGMFVVPFIVVLSLISQESVLETSPGEQSEMTSSSSVNSGTQIRGNSQTQLLQLPSATCSSAVLNQNFDELVQWTPGIVALDSWGLFLEFVRAPEAAAPIRVWQILPHLHQSTSIRFKEFRTDTSHLVRFSLNRRDIFGADAIEHCVWTLFVLETASGLECAVVKSEIQGGCQGGVYTGNGIESASAEASINLEGSDLIDINHADVVYPASMDGGCSLSQNDQSMSSGFTVLILFLVGFQFLRRGRAASKADKYSR